MPYGCRKHATGWAGGGVLGGRGGVATSAVHEEYGGRKRERGQFDSACEMRVIVALWLVVGALFHLVCTLVRLSIYITPCVF